MQMCRDCLPPGSQKITVIYDGSHSGQMKMIWDVKALNSYLAMCFPETIDKIYIVNASATSHALWSIVNKTLDPITASKVIWDHSFRVAESRGAKTNGLLERFDLDHPYVQYLRARQLAKGKAAKNEIVLPAASPYTPTWERTIKEDTKAMQSKSVRRPRRVLLPVSESRSNIPILPPQLGFFCDGREHTTKEPVVAVEPGAKRSESPTLFDTSCGGSPEGNCQPQDQTGAGASQQEPGRASPDQIPTTEPATKKSDVDPIPVGCRSLFDIATELRRNVEVSERTYYFRAFEECFVGSEAVSALISLGHADSVEEAELLGNALVAKQLMMHVVGEHGFKNEYLFYHFADVVNVT
jgi:hypothetical protein